MFWRRLLFPSHLPGDPALAILLISIIRDAGDGDLFQLVLRGYLSVCQAARILDHLP